jgi:hypothetical protein
VTDKQNTPSLEWYYSAEKSAVHQCVDIYIMTVGGGKRGGEGTSVTAHTSSHLQGTYNTEILSVTWEMGEKKCFHIRHDIDDDSRHLQLKG